MDVPVPGGLDPDEVAGRADGRLDPKLTEHEEAAHDKRNWVRLTYDCNDHCIFCLDAHAHDGEMRDPAEVKAQILDGRRKGATRLILSGGEPTIHPRYVDFIRLGRLAGYRKIQTVTNGRMFAYRDFLTRCVDAGLGEITFSIHGPNARIHDALVGVRGAFDEEVRGLDNALEDGRLIVNIDVCVNRGNVKVLPEIIETFVARGVREYDLLHVIPFGRAFVDGRDTLFYDLEEMQPFLQKAFAWSREPDMHIWLNRFPPAHCEGFEELIQDPYKLNDEVRGRKEDYGRYLDQGVLLDCREPERCRYCYLEHLCDTLDEVLDTAREPRFEVVRVDTAFEAALPPVFGGDPASLKHRAEAGAAQGGDGSEKRRLPLVGIGKPPLSPMAPAERARRAGAHLVHVVAPNLARARAAAAEYERVPAIALELADYAGLAEALVDGMLDGRVLERTVAASVAQAEALLAMDAAFEVLVLLDRDTGRWLLELPAIPARVALRQPTYERMTDAEARDVDFAPFFAALPTTVPVDDLPACVLGRAPRSARATLDTAMMAPDGRVEIFRYARRYILDRYYAKSLRCTGCKHTGSCRGMHVNQVRAHGFSLMQPIA